MSLLTINLLVADGSRTIHRIFAGIAANSPLPTELISTADGGECAHILARGDIDVAFLDVNLPGSTGIEVLRGARSEGIGTFTTLMGTAGSMPSIELARQLDVYELLRKPFMQDDVDAILENYRRLSAPMRALIVDDSSTARRVVSRVLAGSVFHIRVEEAGDGESALASCAGREFDLIFLDFNMPGLNGIETLQRLLLRNAAARVIMMSGERNEERNKRAFELGAAAFLGKPFFPPDIDRALHTAFGLRIPQLAAAQEEQKLEAGYASLVARRAALAALG